MMLKDWERDFWTRLVRVVRAPTGLMKNHHKSVQASAGARGPAYPGELVHPRRMDGQFAVTCKNNKSYFLNVELNRGDAYNERKRPTMLDPHLLERCNRVWGRYNYLNLMVAFTDLDGRSQRYRELSRYFEPNLQHNLWVQVCPTEWTDIDVEIVGNKIRALILNAFQ